ncbi:uncharacterized protein F5891DRAFT_1034357 [Suillus fuscotomentosus]|uniref:Uncharacterized protein n=1 Tax=Suillus fuscotomentosus TaxID=1912939 RepID=A0AAD4E870_9AGAM|nr:uncharacterized protein F5891DRAFT_1034357 [Suillus fuscotomentosus]KAG1900123.1 hypothetical protein F5891DRAFT_1034357 [Suillus fuscotomentosus]
MSTSLGLRCQACSKEAWFQLVCYALHALRLTMNKLRKPKPPATIYSPPSSIQTARSDIHNNNQHLVSESVQSKPPVSRTMQIASASLAVERISTAKNTLEYPKTTWYSAPAAAKPRTSVAETVLTTRVQYQKEMTDVRLGKEEKQTLAALMRASEERQSRLEKFVVALLACFTLLFLALIYILLRDSPKSKGASHFTIPILSPFTSVVSFVNCRCEVGIISNGTITRFEHETGIISARSVSFFILVVGILSYAYLPTLVVKKKIAPMVQDLGCNSRRG